MSRSSTQTLWELSAPYIPIILVTYYVVTRTLTWYRLRKFPGPFIGKFSHWFMAKSVWGGQMFEVYTDVSRRYGPLARIGPDDLITDDPEIIRLMSNARSRYLRSSWYEAMRIDPYIDNLTSEMSVPIHDTRRAKIAGAYSGKENTTLEADIDSQIAALVNLIREKYLSSGEIVKRCDFAQKAQFLTLDVITKVAYGDEFGYIALDTDVHDYIKTTEGLVGWLTLFAVVPLANAIFYRSWVKQLIGPKRTDEKGMGRLMGVAHEVASQRFGAGASNDRRDMLGAFVRAGLPQRQIEAEMLFQIIAGSDTTATSIRATMLYLHTHPRVLVKLRHEINTAQREGRISSPITNTESKSLPYLQAVIKEGMRIHPPFTGIIAKKVPEGGDTIKGIHIPGGTRIGHSTWSVQRNEVYGNDVEVFRPERWIEADDERSLRMEQTLDLVFGYGRWGCLGKNVAWIELNKVFVELLRHFEFELIQPTKPWTSANYNLFMQNDMWMRVTER